MGGCYTVTSGGTPATCTPILPPYKPTLVSPPDGARLSESTDLTLAWNSSARATEYAAELWGRPTGEWRRSGRQPGTNWRVGRLAIGEYGWHVEAYNAAGLSGWTGAWSLTIVPNAPTNLRGTPASRSQINLSWDPPGGEKDGYKVYYSYPSNTVTVTTSACLPFVQVSSGDGEDWWPALARAANGTLVIVWQRADVLWQSVSSDEGATWSSATRVTPVGLHPALLAARDGRLWLVYDYNNDVWYRTSTDYGATWSDEVRVTTDAAQDHEPTITQTADGALWLVWASTRVPDGGTVWFKRSTNNGATWSADTPIPMSPDWRTHPTIAQAPDGRIWVAWFQWYDFQYSVSVDDGMSWSPPPPLWELVALILGSVWAATGSCGSPGNRCTWPAATGVDA